MSDVRYRLLKIAHKNCDSTHCMSNRHLLLEYHRSTKRSYYWVEVYRIETAKLFEFSRIFWNILACFFFYYYSFNELLTAERASSVGEVRLDAGKETSLLEEGDDIRK